MLLLVLCCGEAVGGAVAWQVVMSAVDALIGSLIRVGVGVDHLSMSTSRKHSSNDQMIQLTQTKLAEEAFGTGISGKTLRDVMHVTDHWKCIACSRAWCSPELAAKRVAFAQAHLERRPYDSDWETVAFSDEVHAGWGPAGRPRVIRRPGERLCKDCIHLEGVPTGTDTKRVHGWGVFHFKWKSDLLLYDGEEAGNLNGKMSARCYVDRILEPVISPWVEEVKLGRLAPFTLVEDPNGSNGVGVNSEARRWKRKNSRGHIDYHFNERASPDLAPTEQCWQPYKYDVKKYSGWDDGYARELVLNGWEHVKQEQIAMAIHSMLRRLRRCVEMGVGIAGIDEQWCRIATQPHELYAWSVGIPRG